MPKKYINTLDFYGYRENNKMEPVIGKGYKVKVSDKDGNIITIEKDGSLYACVKLGFDANSGTLRLLDAAHDDSVLAEIEMPNANYIYNCRYDEEMNAILFDVKSLYGDETSTIELDVESLVELYEAGQGIEIGEKNEATGRRPISIKLAEGENILQVSDSGLSISDTITTDDELEAAISGKADTEYVDELFDKISDVSGFIPSIFDSLSGLTDDVNSLNDAVDKIKSIIGTEEDDPNLDERIDSKADREELENLDEEIGDLITVVNILSGDTDDLKNRLEEVEEQTEANTSDIAGIKDDVNSISGNVENINNAITDINSNIADLEIEVDNNKVKIEKVQTGLSGNVKEAYVLKNKLGETLGEQINIYYDSTIENIEYVTEDDRGRHGQFLKVTYINSEGQKTYSYIDISEMVIEAEFADGLEVIDGKAYVKIDPSSDGYLTVSENGVKLSGVFQQFSDLLNVNAQQWAAISAETVNRETVDNQLWSAINQEIQDRASGDNALRTEIGVEAENRQAEDERLYNLITAETSARIANDAIISGSIDSKIETEKNRAMLEESRLNSLISEETSNRTSADNALSDRINEETENRENEDAAIRRDLSSEISNVAARIDGIESDLATETSERIREDNEIKDEISTFRDLYAKKEYVDSKDAEWVITAVTSATTLSNQYSDLKNDYLEAELKLYCDSGHTQLQNAISDNATKINAISNLKGVSGTDISNYDDTGNGILDVLHKEFHEYKGETIHNAKGAQIRNEDEIAIGRYNISNKETDQMSGVDIPSGCTIFSVGIGTSDEVRKNALEVRQDGSVYLWIEGEYMCINKLLSMLAHEVY